MAVSNGLWTDELLRPGDLVVVAQGAGEPTPLLEQLIRAWHAIPQLEVFVGLSHSQALVESAARQVSLVSYAAMGPLAALASAGAVEIIPCHFVDVPRVLDIRGSCQLVLVVQVAPADAYGEHSLGVSVDYCYELVGRARTIVAEVNEQMPVTSAPSLHRSVFSKVIHTSRPLPAVADGALQEVHRMVAAHVATLVPNGATIQLGIGMLAGAVAKALATKRDLQVRSTLAGNWLLTLAHSGALRDGPDGVTICEASGTQPLYDYIATSGVQVQPVGVLNSPGYLGAIKEFVAINSALQVDLSGQVNAEQLDSGYFGGIGGQPDFLRAAQRTVEGRSIVMLGATAAHGTRSRIVHRLSGGVVTTPRATVDFVVTEYGVADLRGKSFRERAQALIGIAAPEYREPLRSGMVKPSWE